MPRMPQGICKRAEFGQSHANRAQSDDIGYVYDRRPNYDANSTDRNQRLIDGRCCGRSERGWTLLFDPAAHHFSSPCPYAHWIRTNAVAIISNRSHWPADCGHRAGHDAHTSTPSSPRPSASCRLSGGRLSPSAAIASVLSINVPTNSKIYTI